MNDQNIEYHDSFLDGNESIEEAIHAYYEQPSKDAVANLLMSILSAADYNRRYSKLLLPPFSRYLCSV